MFALLLLFTACKSMPPPIQITANSAQDLNPTPQGRPSPVVVTFYQLKDPTKFKKINYQQLAADKTEIFGDSLLDSTQVEMRPHQQLTKNISLWPETRYLGITAAYRNIANAKWKLVTSIYQQPKPGKSLAKLLGINKKATQLKSLKLQLASLGISLQQ